VIVGAAIDRGADRPRTAAAERRVAHRADEFLRLGAVVDHRADDAVGAGVERLLDVRRVISGTRTSGTVLLVEMPCSIVTMTCVSIRPCCFDDKESTHMGHHLGRPAGGMPHQLLMTALPSAQISRIRFARAIQSSIAPR
jgi:hypothetical protein